MNTAVWKFWGSSDDLAYYSKNGSVDEGAPGTYKLSHPDYGGLLVTIAYAQGALNQGIWMVGVARTDEGQELPEWPCSIGVAPDCPYSAGLTIIAPEGCTLEGFSDASC